jgi:4-hydroxy-3-polyprenylbenzoate decarboxylase
MAEKMNYRSLNEFVADLDAAGELVRITEEVDPVLEVAEIADRVMKQPGGGKGLLFSNVKGSKIPLGINLFGSMKRMGTALGVSRLDDIGDRLSAMLKLEVPDSLMGKLAMLPMLKELAGFPPRTVRSGACQEIVLQGDEIDLGQLPVITCWPDDGGPFITLPLVITKDPVSGIRNVGMYRMQVMDRNTTGMHWQRHKTGASHFKLAKERGERLEVAVALGGDPATIFSATAPLPPAIDEFIFTGFLRRKPMELVKGITVDLEVPAEADIVLEGYVDPSEDLILEGPFGDHTGFYSLADMYPAFHVTAVTMRRDAIYPTTIVGKPPMEDYYMGHATERIFLPLTKLIHPEIVDYHMPAEGIFHNLVFVSIDKEYPGHAYKVMNGLWGMGQMMLAKVIVIVDKDVNVQDAQEAWWVALNNIDPERDVRFTPGPVDVLDHSSRGFTYGTKMGIDATTKWPEEGFDREWPGKIEMSEEVKARVDAMWSKLGIDK